MDKEDAIFAGVFFSLVLVFISGIVALIMIGSSLSCASQAKAMSFEHRWGPFMGCVVEYQPGKWIPLDNYRGVDAKVTQ